MNSREYKILNVNCDLLKIYFGGYRTVVTNPWHVPQVAGVAGMSGIQAQDQFKGGTGNRRQGGSQQGSEQQGRRSLG